jgi:DNA polymerase sigma
MYLRKHKNLDSKIWDQNNILHNDVRDMLLTIAYDYTNYVCTKHNMEIRKQDIKDIIIFGSITNYFYDKKSDIDLCIVFDLAEIKQKYPNLNILQTLKLYYYDWAMIRQCSIRGRKIDLNIEDVQTPQYGDRYRTGPNYSVLQQKWIFEPVAISGKDFKNIKKQGYELYKEIIRDYKNVKRNGYQIQDMESFFRRLMTNKKLSYHTYCDQNITPMYIAFQKIKRHGIIDKLRKTMVKRQTQKFTLK